MALRSIADQQESVCNTMPMKSVQDVPNGFVLTCQQETDVETSFIFMDGDSCPIIELAGLEITLRPPSSVPPLYEWTNIAAGDGWGPFVTDVAMEWVTARGGWLYPHHRSITDVAKRMWKVYHDEQSRPDILFQSLSEGDAKSLRVSHVEPELRCIYRKQESTLIDALRACGKWDDQTE